jgi:iron complex outermembrane receptor protein
MKRSLFWTTISSLLGMLILPAGVALAQATADQGEDEAAVDQEEILVTARRREESLQEIPLTISAFGQEEIRAADLRNLESVGNLTPGFQFMNQGNQQPGRYNTQLQFRGLTTSQFSPSFATGALFIDGIYVLNGGTSLSLMDIERVEVIKGPQSAYFGRNTFGGAVNLITRDPNLQTFGGEFSMSYSDRQNIDASFIFEGPIIADVLSFSVSARRYDKRGQYLATDGGRLGNEETSAFNGVLLWQATENLSFKFRYGYSEDDDGAPAGAFASGIINDSCTGLTIDTPEGPANPTRYICGQVPTIDSLLTDGGVVSQNTMLPSFPIANLAGFPPMDEWFLDNSTNLPNMPGVNGIGLARETTRYSFFGEYEFDSGYALSFSMGDNSQYSNHIRDFDLSDRVSWFSRDPQWAEDSSYEVRLVSPQDGRFRWLVGASLYEQEFFSSGGGGDATTSCFSLVGPLTDDFPAACLGGAPGFTLLFPNSLQNADEGEVTGVFASIDVDITDSITAIIEGRYVEDKLTKGDALIVSDPNAPILSETFDDFLPRVILRWQPTENTNLYASYSEGLIAGDFNTFFINADARERAQYLAQDPRISESLPAETLEAWEVGIKQTLLDGRLQLNFAYYDYTWENIKGRSSFIINETCRPDDIGQDAACNPDFGIEAGDPKQILNPETGELEPFFNSRNIILPGNADIKGWEVETTWTPMDDLVLQFNYSYIDSQYTDYEFNFVKPIAGFAQMAGNQTPRQPKTSYNAAMIKYFDLANHPTYVRLDYIHQGKSYVDESNLAYIAGYPLVHLRAGVSTDDYLIEVFVKNLLDEDAWMTGSRWTDFSSPTQFAYLTAKQGVALSPLDKRELGIRVNYRF